MKEETIEIVLRAHENGDDQEKSSSKTTIST